MDLSFDKQPHLNEGFKIKITTLNIENPYFQLQDEACREFDCPRVKKWQDPKACKHKSKAKDYQSIIKNWEKREDKILDMIKNSHIVCLQEVDFTILQLITKKISTFQDIIPHQTRQHFTAILYEKALFENIERPSKLNLPFACARLKHKTTGKIFDMCCVHLTGYNFSNDIGIEKGNQELTSVCKEMFINKKKSSVSIIAGDFNAPPSSKRITDIMKFYTEEKPTDKENSYSDFTNFNPYTGTEERIDQIFFKLIEPKKITYEYKRESYDYLPSKSQEGYELALDNFIRHRPTDHYPVSIEFKIED